MKKSAVVCHDMNGKLYKVSPAKLSFRPSVYGVIIKNKKILLFKQTDGNYDFPGGGIEIDETIDEALKREVWEETGFKIKKGKLLDCFTSFFYARYRKKFFNTVLVYYECGITGGKLTKKNLEKWEKEYGFGPVWVDLSDFKKSNLIFRNGVDSIGLVKKVINLKK